MKVLYVACKYDPFDHNSGSGSDYDLYHSFLSQGASIEVVGPFVDRLSILERLYRKIHSVFSKRAVAKYSPGFIRTTGKKVQEAAERYQPDVVFSYSAAPLVTYQPVAPVVYMLDTTLKGSQEQRHFFSWIEYVRMLGWERNVTRKSARIITWSDWSAGILHRFYKVPMEKIRVFPRAASLPRESIPEKIVIEKPDFSTLKLLLVGRKYLRKGIDIAESLVGMLNQAGMVTELRIVGQKGTDTAHVKYFGPYNKTRPAELDEYLGHYRWAHFLIHPARFEAAGIVPSEAAAFGLPTITNAAGGLSTTVQDRISGVVLPRNSPAGEYSKAIQYYVAHPDEYLQLCLSTRKRFEQELSWDVTGKRIYAILQEVAAQGSRR